MGDLLRKIGANLDPSQGSAGLNQARIEGQEAEATDFSLDNVERQAEAKEKFYAQHGRWPGVDQALPGLVPEIPRPTEPEKDPSNKGPVFGKTRDFPELGIEGLPDYAIAPDAESAQNLADRANSARKQFKQTRGKGMPSAGSFSYLSAELRPLAGGKYFPRGWEEKMATALKTGKIDKPAYDKAIGQYEKWLGSGLGAQVTAKRAHDDAESDLNLGTNAADSKLAAAEMAANQVRLEGLDKVMNSQEEYMQFEQHAKNQLQQRLADFDTARDRLANMKMNVLGSQEGQIVGAIATAIGGIGATFFGGKNLALDIVNQGIQARAKQLELEYRKNATNVRSAGNAFGMAMRAVGDERAARMATMNMLYRNTERHVDGLLQVARSASTKEKLGVIKDRLAQEIQLSENDMRAQLIQQSEQEAAMMMRARRASLGAARAQAAAGSAGMVVMDKPPTGQDIVRLVNENGEPRSLFVEAEAAKRYGQFRQANQVARMHLQELRAISQRYGGNLRGMAADVSDSADAKLWRQHAAKLFVAAKEMANTGANTTELEMQLGLPVEKSISSIPDFFVSPKAWVEKGDVEAQLAAIESGFDSSWNATQSAIESQGTPAAPTAIPQKDGTFKYGYVTRPMDMPRAAGQVERARPGSETSSSPWLVKPR